MSKASRLNELKKYGFNVPFFIIIKNLKDLEKLNQLNQEIKYSVRSSASIEDGKLFSFAGMFDTYLNIDFEHLKYYINRCFNSKNKQRVREYIRNCKIDVSNFTMEIIVQKMIDSDISGVSFIYDPIHYTENTIIEAVYGLGVGHVEGKFVPDIIHIKSNEIDYKVSFQEKMLKCDPYLGVVTRKVPILNQSMHKLCLNRIKKIINLIKKLRQYFDFPFEIEWSFYKGKLYLLQLRPITRV